MQTTTGNKAIAWALFLIALLANAAGYIFNLFNQIAWYDDAVHLYTLFALTLVVALYLYGDVLTGKRDHSALLILTVLLIGLGIGGAWEMVEWVYDQWFAQGNVIQGKTDTVIDLLMDTIGALLAGILTAAMAKERLDEETVHRETVLQE